MKKYPDLSEVELVEGKILCIGCVYYDRSMPECQRPVVFEIDDDLPDCIPGKIYKLKQPSK